MTRRDCPDWCTPTTHNADPGVHRSAPVEITTPAGRYVLHIESGLYAAPFLTVAHFQAPMDPTDELTFEPDSLLMLKLGTAAEVAAGISSLIARALGGAR
ncbi:hypothetical protein [Micromonospora tulbaghiae]|uniref:hypothetical protein n=1 Tax=Micromonospora tulbaghiae TaxID=479978 RepID=UPI003EBE3C60